MQPGVADRDDDPVDVPPSCNPCHHDATPSTTSPAPPTPRRSGVLIPYSVLQVLAVLAGGGMVGLLIALRWPQAVAVLGTICAIIGAGLAVLDIMMRRDGTAGSGRDQA